MLILLTFNSITRYLILLRGRNNLAFNETRKPNKLSILISTNIVAHAH